jgi:hypothetical protein
MLEGHRAVTWKKSAALSLAVALLASVRQRRRQLALSLGRHGANNVTVNCISRRTLLPVGEYA